MTTRSTVGGIAVPTGQSAARSRRLGGVLLIALAGGFLTGLMLLSAMAPGYDFHDAAISDLGVIPETALLFNGALILVGLLNVTAGVYYYRSHGQRWLLGVFGLASVGAVVAGLFPLDTGGMHTLGALLAFLGFNVQALGVATRVRGAMRAVSFLAGGLGLAFVALMIYGDAGNPAVFEPIGHAGAERMIIYPVMGWMLAFGGYLVASAEETPA
jgi:hypothetical membrane protein